MTPLVELLDRHAPGWWSRTLSATLTGGLFGAAAVVGVNAGSRALTTEGAWTEAILFGLVLALMFVGNRASAQRLVTHLEEAQHRLRTSLSEGLRAMELDRTERWRHRFERALDDLDRLSAAVPAIVLAVQGATFLVVVTGLVALISTKALLIWLVTFGAAGLVLARASEQLGAAMGALADSRAELHGMGTAFAAGVVQLKLDHRAGAEFERELDRLFDAADGRQAEAQAIGHQISFRAMCVVLGGVGVAIFAPEGGIGLPAQLSYELAALIQLSISPVFQVVRSLPALRNANDAAGTLMAEIERFGAPPVASPSPQREAAPSVHCEGLEYAYPTASGQAGFSVGPLDLTLEPGTLVFVTGGNGSGKTTLMKLLTGLYAPDRGTIRIGPRHVTPASRQAYRDHFTTIFGPPFLFERTYGLEVGPDDVVDALDRFGITDMVGFDGERFATLDLSSGQAMRLAMVVALLEDRPICVFDEWTANQDPQMTRYYYETLLPELVGAGRIVIAVSHDDRFFDLADLHIRLDRGAVEVVRGPGGHRR